MTRVVLVLQVQDPAGTQTVDQLKQKLGLVVPSGASVNPDETMAKVANFISACQGSVIDVAVKVAVTETEPTVPVASASDAKTFSLSAKAYAP